MQSRELRYHIFGMQLALPDDHWRKLPEVLRLRDNYIREGVIPDMCILHDPQSPLAPTAVTIQAGKERYSSVLRVGIQPAFLPLSAAVNEFILKQLASSHLDLSGAETLYLGILFDHFGEKNTLSETWLLKPFLKQ